MYRRRYLTTKRVRALGILEYSFLLPFLLSWEIEFASKRRHTQERNTQPRDTNKRYRYVRTRWRGSIQHKFATRSVANSVRRHRSRGHVEIRADRQSTSRLAGAVRGETFHAPILRAGGERVHEQSRVRDETEDAFAVRVTAAAGGRRRRRRRRVDWVRSRKRRVRKRECKRALLGQGTTVDLGRACTIIKIACLEFYLDERYT